MKKNDFILKTENWLVENDLIEPEYRLSFEQIQKKSAQDYISLVYWGLQDKAPSLLSEFKRRIKEAKLRNIDINCKEEKNSGKQ